MLKSGVYFVSNSVSNRMRPHDISRYFGHLFFDDKNKKNPRKHWVFKGFGGEEETRTPAPGISRPTPLAGAGLGVKNPVFMRVSAICVS